MEGKWWKAGQYASWSRTNQVNLPESRDGVHRRMLSGCWLHAGRWRLLFVWNQLMAKEVHRDHSARAQVHLQTHDATRIASYVSGLAGVKFVVLQGGG